MKTPLTTNKAGIDLIKNFEGTGPVVKGFCHPYICPAGYWTIGYGSRFLADGTPVTGSTTPISLDDAEKLLAATLKQYEDAVNGCVKAYINENQFAALVSFVYNLGPASLRSSSLLKFLNVNNYAAAADEFPKWNKGRVNGILVELPGLTKRRAAERALFKQAV